MGKFVAQYGKTVAVYRDYQWDYIKQNKPLDYYKNKTFIVELKDLDTNEIQHINVPILDNFISLTLKRKNYKYKHIRGNTLLKWLSTYIKESVYCLPYITMGAKILYLNNEIGKPSTFTEHRKIYEIKCFEDLKALKVDSVFWCNKEGKEY